MKKFNRLNKKDIQRDVVKLANKLEGILFDSKKWVVVVIMPTIDILLNIASLMNGNDNHRDDEWY